MTDPFGPDARVPAHTIEPGDTVHLPWRTAGKHVTGWTRPHTITRVRTYTNAHGVPCRVLTWGAGISDLYVVDDTSPGAVAVHASAATRAAQGIDGRADEDEAAS